ncbi:uncharacterized protein K444DRAFT_613071 [Hyaloscypha bicolor E]|uniref:Cell wall protein n=1 Tax=Hyaloscypha bicolor E TaxID=1095630 RepID=A0A2J6TAQ1_9HELO|nr:uncharacterized protein K444DRAFT_613071 [Hyaloscypha bicolor E]PMD60048.1 hypothetical protein K444DRAFT_613071 [Hyaloscypha bicolor E]
MRLRLLITTLSCLLIAIVYSSPLPINSLQPQGLEIDDPLDSLPKRASSKATTRTKATTVTQSVNNWIEDVNTVNKFLNVALALPAGPALKAGASKALAFAQDEPVNVKLLKATPGIDTAGLSAAATLEKVFGDVLDQLGNVVSQPLSLPVAINAVARINVNRLVVKAMKLEICGWNCMNLRGADARMCFQLQRRCGDLLRSR